MKVMFVLSGLGVGGAERVISLISEEWINRGWEVAIVAFDSPRDPLGFNFAPGIDLIRLGIPAGGGSKLRGIRSSVMRITALRRLMKERRPDIVLSFLTKVNVLTLIASTGTPVPVVISERNNPQAQAAHPVWARAWVALSHRAKGIVLQTETIRGFYPPGIGERATVIPNVVEAPAREARPHEGKVLVAAGRLDRQKGFDLLIAAFARIAGRFPEWRLVIWGEGQERAALEAQVRATGLVDRIALPGNSPRPVSWVEEADLFVMSSRYEGFGNVVVEAMQAGLPVVSYDCNFGPRDIIAHGEDGLLVKPESVSDLADSLARMMADPALRKRLATKARKTSQRFNRAAIVSLWDSLVHKVVYSAKGV